MSQEAQGNIQKHSYTLLYNLQKALQIFSLCKNIQLNQETKKEKIEDERFYILISLYWNKEMHEQTTNYLQCNAL